MPPTIRYYTLRYYAPRYYTIRAIPPLFNGPEVLSSAFDKSKFLRKTLLRTLILITRVSLYLFPF